MIMTDTHQALFAMVNAPPEPEAGCSDPQVWVETAQKVMDRLKEVELIQSSDTLIWSRTPADPARQFPGSRGAIYGAASNNRMAAFQRPPNKIPTVNGLYLASGSAHPGGGMPLAMVSGKAAVQSLLSDRG